MAEAVVALGGRPPATSHARLARAAIGLFQHAGFDETTIDSIVAAAGVGRRTFFRYFASKSALLWYDFDDHLDQMRAALADAPAQRPMMAVIRDAVLRGNDYGPDDLPELRVRMALISTVPTLQASATLHFARWEQVVADYVAGRLALPAGSLYPTLVGRCVFAACRSAFDRWAAQEAVPLTAYLGAALDALGEGFEERSLCVNGRRLALLGGE